MKPRKHISQMTRTEVAFVVGYIRRYADSLQGTGHFVDRATERVITLAEAREVAKQGSLVEINQEGADFRALIRRNRGAQAGICVVVSLTKNCVVTTYYNAPEDTHSTLNRNAYQWKADAVQLVKNL